MFKWAIRGRWYCGRANGRKFNEHSVVKKDEKRDAAALN
jgi:hypothetical protein